MAIGKRLVDRIDSRTDTYKHIHTVQKYMARCISNLSKRQLNHDQSKLVEPEVGIFDEYTPKLKTSTYGSDEYKSFLSGMKVALDHHYATNDHHPEHYTPEFDEEEYTRLKYSRDEIEFNHTGTWATDAVMIMDADLASRASSIRHMNLLSLTELICDWLAACERHDDGDIFKSIEINQKRFGYTDELKEIMRNTVYLIIEEK